MGQETNIVANQDIQFAKVYGGKIDLSKPEERKKSLCAVHIIYLKNCLV